MTSVAGIVLALVLLIALAYRGVSVLLLAPLCALLAALFSPDAPLLASYTQVFMKALGAFTFTMTALTGTPAIQNAIPMPFFGTTPFAAPGLGAIGGAVILCAGWWWIARRAAAARRAGEGYGDEGPAPAHRGSGNRSAAKAETFAAPAAMAAGHEAMPFGMALAPVVLVIGLNYVLSTWLWPVLDTSYLADARYGRTTVQAVRGVWAVIGTSSAAIALLTALWWLARRRAAGQGLPLKSVLE